MELQRKATKAIFIQPPVYKHTFPAIVAILKWNACHALGPKRDREWEREKERVQCALDLLQCMCLCVRAAKSSKRCLRCALKCNTKMHRKERHPYSWIYVCIVHICHCHWIVQWVVIWNHFNPLIFAHAWQHAIARALPLLLPRQLSSHWKIDYSHFHLDVCLNLYAFFH